MVTSPNSNRTGAQKATSTGTSGSRTTPTRARRVNKGSNPDDYKLLFNDNEYLSNIRIGDPSKINKESSIKMDTLKFTPGEILTMLVMAIGSGIAFAVFLFPGYIPVFGEPTEFATSTLENGSAVYYMLGWAILSFLGCVLSFRYRKRVALKAAADYGYVVDTTDPQIPIYKPDSKVVKNIRGTRGLD